MRHISIKGRIRLPQIGMAALFAIALTLAASAIAPIATAEPNNGGGSWDIEKYEQCLKTYNPGQGSSLEDIDSRLKWCCEDSGGVWTGDKQGCVAPSGNSVGPRQVPSDIGTETLTPVPPRIHDPSDIGTETFTPAATPTPPPTTATTQAPPIAVPPCQPLRNPLCR